MITRFGEFKLGLVWLLVDPLVSVIFLGLILGPFIGRANDEMPYAFFLLCGFMILKTFLSPLNSSIGAVKANQGLLVFRQVKPINIFVARYIFALLTNIFAFTVFCLIAIWIDIPLSGEKLFTLAATFILIWLVGCGLGLTIGILCLKVKELEKIQQYLQRPLLWISCILFPLSSIPEKYAKILAYNPIVHCVEISRNCLYPNYTLILVNLVYPLIFALISVALGLMVYRNNRHFLSQK
jgi:capsular polysaccharide transport system permease protein